MNKIKIVIIGAGLAGLASAYELSKYKQCSVTLIEANNYLGGRVKTLEINKEMVDFGGFIIYPWYKYFHELINEFKIDTELSAIPLNKIFYDIYGDGKYLESSELDLPLKETIKMGVKSLLDIISDLDIANPNLEIFEKKTISEYIRSLSTSLKDARLYEKFFDTICQGYCYGPVDKYKTAFVAPIVRQTMLHGDIKTASFFRKGNNMIINNFAEKIKKNGGKIILNTKIVKVDKDKIYSLNKSFQADAFIFTQTMSLDLYNQIIPDISPDFKYTTFITATLKFEHSPSVNGSADWGAVFYAPDKKSKIQILSSINLKTLYSYKLCGYVNVNIVIKGKSFKALNKKTLFDLIKIQSKSLFTDYQCKEIVEMVNWEKTMPIADEDFVSKINNNQGINNYYFAGDYLGCPSMETALVTGLYAAKKILTSHNITKSI